VSGVAADERCSATEGSPAGFRAGLRIVNTRQGEGDTGSQGRIFGHPRGLLVLAGTELWDRISFSGMQAILVLYMVERLFLPGHIDHITAFTGFRHGIESVTGPLSSQALASQIFGLYVGLIYFTPTFGGFVGDRFLGRSRSVTLGALLMTAGHFCMAFEASFLAALLLLIVGAGFLRGNLTPQVAELYGPDDRRRPVAFQVYFSMVSLGAFVAPLVTGALSQFYDWDIAFGFAGFGMLAGLTVYLLGRRSLPPDVPRQRRSARVPLRSDERSTVWVLLALIPIATLFWIAQAQIWNTYNLWVRDHVNLRVWDLIVPVPWLQSLDGLAPFVALPLLLLFWRWQGRRGSEPDEYTRMSVGLLIFGASVSLLAAGEWITDPTGKTPLLVPVAFHLISNVGWLYFAPSANSLFAGAAPAAMRGTMIGVYTLSMFFGSVISGRLGGLYESVRPSLFWSLHAGVALAGGLLLLLISPRLRRVTNASSAISKKERAAKFGGPSAFARPDL
jgi:POT family proton-dependent oligopeptide transporter